jgi:hypothetical protein
MVGTVIGTLHHLQVPNSMGHGIGQFLKRRDFSALRLVHAKWINILGDAIALSLGGFPASHIDMRNPALF